ncbi:MAG: hypothetical protein ACQ9IQ_11270 [Nitrospirales bacterium]
MANIPTSRIVHQLIGITLSVCFIFVGTTLTQNLSIHLHHGPHDQQTHEQTWCSWSCQAGHGIQVLSTFVENSAQVLTLLDLPSPKIPYLGIINQPTSRGPPGLLK